MEGEHKLNFQSKDIGRKTVAKQDTTYFVKTTPTRRPLKDFFTRRRLVLLSSIVLVLIAAVIVLLFFWHHADDSDPGATVPATESKTDPTFVQQVETTTQSANESFDQSGTAEVITTYQEAIDNPAYSDEQKSVLYLERAEKLTEIQDAYGDTLDEQIIADLLQAEALAPSFETAQALYVAYYGVNDQEAEKYLKIMQERNPGYDPAGGQNGRG